jgi:hypothetical protein
MSFDPRTAAADDLLQALTVGDVSAGDPAVEARFAADAELRARWQTLAATLAELRELDAGLRDGSGATGAQIDTLAAVRAFRGRTARRRWLVVVAAAAALLVGMWLVDQGRRPVPDPLLGGSVITGLAPPDDVDWPAGEPLRWSAVRGAAGYRVQVRSLPDGAELMLPHGLDGERVAANAWLPTATERAALPERFEWRVIAFDGSNTQIATSAWVKTRR